MKFNYCICLVYILSYSWVSAQNGEHYFQQKVDYDIKAKLDDQSQTLTGHVRIAYTNKSRNTLDTIWFHLWPNAYSSRSTPLCKQLVTDMDASLFFADKADQGAIDSISFEIDNKRVQTQFIGDSKEMAALILNEKIGPDETVIITTPFRIKVPHAKFSRMGREGDAYYMTQWYPKPAVYDQEGWHPMPYLNRGEFYAEFGDYQVELEVATDYIVAASGTLVSEEENEFLRNLNRKPTSNDSADDLSKAATSTKKLRFVLEKAHDFAWFADRDFRVILDTVTLESGKRVATAVYHTSKRADLWQDAKRYSERGLKFLSKTIGEYPYETFTVVDGRISAGGGMEYPSITILNSPSNAEELERVLVHELGHNWFYGALASNERSDPWMDEGMNTYYEQLYMHQARISSRSMSNGVETFLGKVVGVSNLSQDSLFNFILDLAGFDHQDQPIRTHSEQFTSFNYGVIAYLKTAKAFELLFNYLGPDRSSACIRNYYEQWKFRHPTPNDLQTSFEKSSGEDLNWFFNDWLKVNDPLLISASGESDEKTISISRKAGPMTPMQLTDAKGKSAWVKPFNADTIIDLTDWQPPIAINRGYQHLLKSQDVIIQQSFKKAKPGLRIRMAPSLHNPYGFRHLTMIPLPSWNSYDRTMGGLYFSNRNLVPQKTEFSIFPLYSFERSKMSGVFNLTRNFWSPSGIISNWQISISGKSFGYDLYENTTSTAFALKRTLDYKKAEAGVKLFFRNTDPQSKMERSLEFRGIGVFKEEAVFEVNNRGVSRVFEYVPKYFNAVTYTSRNARKIDPYSFAFSLTGSDDHLKIAGEINYRLSYKKERKGFDARLFFGTFLFNETTRNYNFKMSAWNGADDYLFDGTYLGRSETTGMWSRQMLVRDGGFINPMSLGQSGVWLAALHLSTDNPTPLPIRAFVNLGTYEGINSIFDDLQNRFMFEGGLTVSLAKGIAEVHFPLFQSEDIQRTLDANNLTFADRVRFVLDLNKLSFEPLRNRIINGIR